MLLPKSLHNEMLNDDKNFLIKRNSGFDLPPYDPRTHYLELTKSGYFAALILFRHYLKLTTDYYFCKKIGAKNIDLFMLTPSVSSPMGPGSDSEVIEIDFEGLQMFLVDSSQFGFEPLIQNGFNKIYCYLPSMRGEKPDRRHLNQFFHCELEIAGTIDDLIPIIEGYVRTLALATMEMPNILNILSTNSESSIKILTKIVRLKTFPVIDFAKAYELITREGLKDWISEDKFGRYITSDGEVGLAEILNMKSPFWIKNYDRNTVPFYQKPDPNNQEQTINADLIFPPIIRNSFGGEVLGCGQRQDNCDEIYETLIRQGINSAPYEWYIDLRRLPDYRATSGFGLGIERFITWATCRNDIKNSICYPRLKGIKSYP
jgi:asparaginyl-tRNA synthetase